MRFSLRKTKSTGFELPLPPKFAPVTSAQNVSTDFGLTPPLERFIDPLRLPPELCREAHVSAAQQEP